MKRPIGCIVCFLFFYCFSSAGYIVYASDSIRVSLITCSPGSEIYALFGHTAIRYEEPAKEIDVVFNYGVFSFEAPHFIRRFVRGETDYSLWVYPYDDFLQEYMERGSTVTLQELNLSKEEKMSLFKNLNINFRPENRIYRYNYFYDNCTTRARDMVEQAVRGRVDYSTTGQSVSAGEEEMSFRQIIHRFTAADPWAELGIDILLGSEADKPVDRRLLQFAPYRLSDDFQNATILSAAAGQRSLVACKTIVQPDSLPNCRQHLSLSFITPVFATVAVLLLTLFLSLVELFRRKHFWLWDIFLYGLQGMIGCVIAFLFFFSLHPAVSSNYLIAVFNPIPLLYLPFMLYFLHKRKQDFYHLLSVSVIFIFCLFSLFVFPQDIPVPVYLFLSAIVLRSFFHILY